MTLVAPGFAQLSVGNRRVGRVALWTAVALVGSTILLGGLWLVSRRSVFSLLFHPPVLFLAHWVILALAIGWVALFVDAWRLGYPLTLHREQRLKLFCLTSALSLVTATALLFTASYVGSAHRLVSGVFGDGSGEGEKAGRYNVLLLGGDAGKNRTGLRPDSITVASVDAETGASVLFGLPRNLQKVPFPEGTIMHKQWPDGFDCGDECLLNAVYTWAETHKDVFPGVKWPGIAATREAVEAITGLEISYTVMIDLQGFKHLVDAVGGISVQVGKRVPIGADGGPTYGWIERGEQGMDGETALWFARSRKDSSDYERMARQKCVLSAMLKQLDPTTVLTSFRGLATASAQTIWTDAAGADLDELMTVARMAKAKTPKTVNFVPPTIKPSDPDFPLIRKLVQEAIDPSETVEVSNATPASAGDAPKEAGDSDEQSADESPAPTTPVCGPPNAG